MSVAMTATKPTPRSASMSTPRPTPQSDGAHRPAEAAVNTPGGTSREVTSAARTSAALTSAEGAPHAADCGPANLTLLGVVACGGASRRMGVDKARIIVGDAPLLLRTVDPPLAVGILGGWGSGKSSTRTPISRYIS